MVTTGDWIVPHLSGREHFTKPPLTYWLAALGMRIFGVNAFGARLATALAFACTVWCVMRLARRLRLGETAARAAAFAQTTAALPFAAGHLLTTDALLALFETLAILCVVEVWRAPRHGNARRIGRFGFWIALALAFLTKGPPGLLPLGILALFAVVSRRRSLFARLWGVGPFLAFLAIASSWFVAIAWRAPHALHEMVFGQFVAHVVSSAGKKETAFWYYVPVLIGGALPWTLTWPWSVRRWWRSGSERSRRPALAARYCTFFAAVSFVVFSASQARLTLYVLPILPLLALPAGVALDQFVIPALTRSRALRAVGAATACVWFAALTGFVACPDSAPFSHSFVGFANAVREDAARDGAPIAFLDVEPVPGVEFALDRVLPTVFAFPPDGTVTTETRPILVLDSKRREQLLASDEYRANPSAWSIVAERRYLTAIRYPIGTRLETVRTE